MANYWFFYYGMLTTVGLILLYKAARFFFGQALKAWKDYQKSLRVISENETLEIVFKMIDKNYSVIFGEIENEIRKVVDRHSIRSNSVVDIPQILTHALISRLIMEHPEHPKNKREEVN